VFHPRIILHPTDFSERAVYAFHIAADLARQNQATLLILHVAETLGPENVTYGEAASKLEPDDYRQRLETDLRRSVPAPSEVATQYVLAAGHPAHEISRAAREHACDLIVMGTHGTGGLSRLLMASIAEHVIRLAPCPVLVCKLPAPPSA
jgi:nucleotide-binding universal stress UspA family protein